MSLWKRLKKQKQKQKQKNKKQKTKKKNQTNKNFPSALAGKLELEPFCLFSYIALTPRFGRVPIIFKHVKWTQTCRYLSKLFCFTISIQCVFVSQCFFINLFIFIYTCFLSQIWNQEVERTKWRSGFWTQVSIMYSFMVSVTLDGPCVLSWPGWIDKM